MRHGALLVAARVLALPGLALLIDASTSVRAQDSDKRRWRLAVEGKQPRLDYGSGNPEDTPIAFSCTAGSGRVDVWINETGQGVKPGRSMTASLTAGRTTSKVPGRTLPNEEAGTPSFEGKQPADDPLFAALQKERLLVVTVGPSRDQLSLSGIGDKADRFSRLCRKQ